MHAFSFTKKNKIVISAKANSFATLLIRELIYEATQQKI
jgi:hypothetical protein